MTNAEVREFRAEMLRAYLIKNPTPITYGTVMKAFGINRFEIARILGRIVEMDNISHGRLHSSLVVNKKTMKPKRGFFEKAKDVGAVPAGMTEADFVQTHQDGNVC